MTQPDPSTAQFQLVYYGTPGNEGAMSASDFASILLGVNTLVDVSSRAVSGYEGSANLSVRGIRHGSIEIQFAIDLAWNVDMQAVVNLMYTAEDLKKLLFGGAGVGGVLAMFKLLRGRQPRQVIERDDRIVRIELQEGAPFEGHRVAVDLYQDPEIRRGVQHIVRPIVELHLDRLVVRDGKEDLEEITRDEAFQIGVAESEKREQDIMEVVREELRTGFVGINERIDNDIGSWALLGRMIGQMKDRLDEIDRKLS